MNASHSRRKMRDTPASFPMAATRTVAVPPARLKNAGPREARLHRSRLVGYGGDGFDAPVYSVIWRLPRLQSKQSV